MLILHDMAQEAEVESYSHVSIRFYCHSVTITINSFHISSHPSKCREGISSSRLVFFSKCSFNSWNRKGSEGCEKWSGGFFLDTPHSKGKKRLNVIKRKEKSFSWRKGKISHFICVRLECESGRGENEEICFLTSKHTPEHWHTSRRNWLDHGWPELNGGGEVEGWKLRNQ